MHAFRIIKNKGVHVHSGVDANVKSAISLKNYTTKFSSEGSKSFNRRMCFITEMDFDYGASGGVLNDQKMLSCLKEFGDVDVIYFQRKKYRVLSIALLVFIFDIVRAFSKPYEIYFSRGLIPSAVMATLKPFYKHKKTVHRNQIAFASSEVKYLKLSPIDSFIRYYLFRFIEKTVLPKEDAITVLSSVYKYNLIKDGVEKDKIFVIPYYAENEFFEQPIKYAENGIFTFSYIGSFHAYHDIAPIIEAFKILIQNNKNVKLVLVGDGIQRHKIEKLVQERELDGKVVFKGRIPHSCVPNFLSAVDAFVYMTRTAGMSTSLLEAAASGKPIITLRKRRDSSLMCYFKHGKEIYMVNNLSPVEIARALELLYRDSKLRISLAEGARKVALENFNRKATLYELEKLVSAVTANRMR